MNDPVASTPAADGYHLPAEWEPQAGCWMAWPVRPDNWRDEARPAQAAYAAVADAIAQAEPVTLTAPPDQVEAARAATSSAVTVVELATDDAWMRDIGPSFVVDGQGHRRGVDWMFNAWGGLDGGLYAPWDRDDAAAALICAREGAPRYRAPLVLEGGSIHVDGQGTLLTTEQCLLNPNRNPDLDRAQIEAQLRAHTGAETILWLGEGVWLDETDGHVDNLACFVRPGVVVLTWTDDRDDPQYAISLDARRRLEGAVDAQGRTIEVHLLPQPRPPDMTDAEASGIATAPGTKPRRGGERLAASYVNFFIANDRVVMPRLDPRLDDQAESIVAGLFPDRQVVGVQTREILLGGGNIHCITQQVPAI
jgi:agmatine deiminase